jgi:tRNA (mo5U34)-methyltransferase
MDHAELKQRILDHKYFQRFSIPPLGIETPGTHDIAAHIERVRLPGDLSGMRVLDAGANDGAMGFACEHRNAAEVFALDHPTWGFANQENTAPRRQGFDLAHEALGSKVIPVVRDLDTEGFPPEWAGTFDLVLFLGVLYHLRNFISVLQGAAGLLKPGGLLICETHVGCLEVPYPACRLYPNAELLGDRTNWVGPNPMGVLGFFTRFGLIGEQVGATAWGMDGNHRAAFHGRRPAS